MFVANGSADVTTYFVLRDSTNHAPKADVTVTDIDLYYVEQGAAISGKADATALDAADSAHADSKAFHVGQGLYRIDWPDAAFDGGVGKRVVLIVVCTGVDTTFLEVELSPPVDVRGWLGTTCHAATVNGIPVVQLHASDAGGGINAPANFEDMSITDTTGLVACAATQKVDVETIKTQAITCGAGVTVGAYVGNATAAVAVNGSGYVTYANAAPPSAADIADAVWDEASATHTDAGKAGAQLWTDIDAILEDTGTTIPATALSNAVWTDVRAGKLDNIPAGTMPTQAEVLAIQNNTRVRVIVPAAIERPDSDSTTYRLWLYCYDEVGNMEAPDSLPTVSAQNNVGTDRSANLSAVSNPSTGVYYADYTVAVAHALEGLLIEWTIVEGGLTRKHGAGAMVVDTTAVDFTAADRTKLETLATDYTTARAAKLDNLDATTSSRLASGSYTAPPSAATVSAQVAADLATAHGAGSWATATGFALASVWTPTVAGYIDVAISSRHASGAAVAKSPATLDWTADVSNKPTIGTSTLDAAGVRTAVGLAAANLDTQLGDKTGYKLASDGLDSVSTTGPNGVAANFRERLNQLWRRFFGKATMTATTLTTYRDDGTTAATTQTLSEVDGTQTQGESGAA